MADDQDFRKLTIVVAPITRVRLEALSTLLQQPAWRIFDQALALFTEAQQPDDRAAVETLTARAVHRLNAPERVADRNPLRGSKAEYRLTEKARTRRPGTVVHGITQELDFGRPFSKAEFAAAVSKALAWSETERKFKSETRFRNLDQAVAAWWNEFKNKLHLLSPIRPDGE